MKRVLMLELDSLSLSFIRENLDKLKTIAKLLTEGRLVETGSTADIASASVWPTFVSGKLPGEHGHYFPFQWHAEDMYFYRPYKKAWCGALDYEPFWHELAKDGLECMVLDAVQTVPQPDSPCLEINNWSAQSSGKALASDPKVLDELRRRFGRRPIGADVPVSKSRRLTSSLLTQALRSLKQKSDAIIWLGQSRNWQFYLASIQDLHRAGHNFWPAEGDFASDVAPGALLQMYQAMDQAIARILTALQDENTTVILFTLNGMAPNKAQNHFLPQILSRLNRLYLTGESPKEISRGRDGLMARLRDQVPPLFQFFATRALGEKVQDWVVNREFTGALNWASTPSFPLVTGGEGLIRLNLKGREREGILSSSDSSRDRYVDWLTERILDIRVVNSGEALVSDVIDVHDLYPGDHSWLLPDIALKWAPAAPATEIHSNEIGTIRHKLKTGRGGNHTGDSFALISGDIGGAGIASGLAHIKDYKKLVKELLGPGRDQGDQNAA